MLFFCQSVQQDSPFEWSILIVANGSGTISNFGIRILFKTLRVSCRNALRSLHPESCRYSSWWDVVDAKGEQNREFILHSKLCHSHFKIHSFWTSSTLPNCLRLLIDLQHPVQILHHYRNDTPPLRLKWITMKGTILTRSFGCRYTYLRVHGCIPGNFFTRVQHTLVELLKLPSEKETDLPTIIFQGRAVKLPGSNFWYKLRDLGCRLGARFQHAEWFLHNLWPNTAAKTPSMRTRLDENAKQHHLHRHYSHLPSINLQLHVF